MKYAKWWLPILLMMLITPFTPMLDMGIERYFFDHNHEQFIANPVTYFFYEYGTIPAHITTFAASIIFLLSYCFSRWKKWRAPALVYLLTVAIGAGVIVHGVFKEHWGRPRPKQVIEFGGGQEFRPYYKPNFFDQPEPSKSFACGHCTMGFCFIAVALAGRRLQNNTLYYTGIALTIVLGVGLSMTRMAQGGHFLSDILASALIMWFCAITFDWLIEPARESSRAQKKG